MPKTTKIYKYRSNRKKIFEIDDLRLWMSARPKDENKTSVAVLELTRRSARFPSKWETIWSGIINPEGWGVTVEKELQ
jgi:hypothetical protein